MASRPFLIPPTGQPGKIHLRTGDSDISICDLTTYKGYTAVENLPLVGGYEMCATCLTQLSNWLKT